MKNKSTQEKVVLELLTNLDTWVSGDYLAKKFQVSRETIWKAINNLKNKRDYPIVSRKKRGYMLHTAPYLEADLINIYGHKQLTDNLHVFKEVTSTQDLAKQFSSKHCITRPTVFVADKQTNGYGRRGRSFYSPPTTGLYLSIILPNQQQTVIQPGLLTTGIAVSITHVLEKFYPNKEFQFKWVNDIYLNYHKVGGIITESIFDLELGADSAFIVGVGINLTTVKFPKELAIKAQAIDNDNSVNRNQLIAEIIQAIINGFLDYTNPQLLAEYRKKSIVLGKVVSLNTGSEVIQGVAQKIEDNGGITIKRIDGTFQTFTSGEVIKTGFKYKGDHIG